MKEKLDACIKGCREFNVGVDKKLKAFIGNAINSIREKITSFKLFILSRINLIRERILAEAEKDRVPVLTINLVAISLNLAVALSVFLFLTIGIFSNELVEIEPTAQNVSASELRLEPSGEIAERELPLPPLNQTPSPPEPISQPPKQPPIEPQPPEVKEIYVPPEFVKPYQNKDVSDVPEYLRFFTQQKCYWDMREKYKFGSYFNPCEICSQPGVYGMWKKACDCCDISYGYKREWEGA